MKNVITFDIETVPTTSEKTIAKIRAEIENEKLAVTAPANYKDSEKIAAYVAEKYKELDADFDRRFRQTALNGARGHIYCISAAINDDAPICFYDKNESIILHKFFELFAYSGHRQNDIYCGHNIASFDLPFIYQRAVILGVKPPDCIPFHAKPWDARIFDTLVKWCGIKGEGSMDSVYDALGIEGKGDITGKTFYDAVLAGRHDECLQYCNDDVIRTREMYRRMAFVAA